ncbi:CGNR zinc finger domain-containing protein [Myceligenerans xiligouense]|uniref:Putative stress-induced transcription regulator n=1 Tax=Myceligenerans xiligouense TaxID=253184 RepID=A0A3N4YPE8_9MICO|nr:CGNR zinc finger domain-containing protein [Myceligenerans xiligouense]RPF21346.1 putative stress-induced transcription regulator [Myceligenerans xiligouense]
MNVVTRNDEDLLLDLLNTTPVVDGERTDVLTDPDASQEWAAGHGGAGSAGESATLRRVRAAIQDVVRGVADAQTLEEHVERIELRPRLRDGVLGWELRVPADEALAARALLAWTVLDERAPGRLRPCANPDCHRFLHDRSNANSARWCSMAVCGNRFKARRHYRRTRKAD